MSQVLKMKIQKSIKFYNKIINKINNNNNNNNNFKFKIYKSQINSKFILD